MKKEREKKEKARVRFVPWHAWYNALRSKLSILFVMASKTAQKAQIRAWIDSGESRVTTILRVCSVYSLTYARASALVQAAVQDVVDAAESIERSQFLAQQMARLESLAAKAQEEGNLTVALGCYRELHHLAGLT